MSSGNWPAGIAVLIPVFNHARTVGAVVTGCRAAGAPYILVVDDGSQDGSGDEARLAGADAVLRVEPNQGKGHVLRYGLKHLAAQGWQQVLSCDADMQHPPPEAARLAQAATREPAALWLGCRDMAGAPLASRVGRWWTSLWTWVSCGCWPTDNQTGLRVYPLPAMTSLTVRAGRYAFEVESLVRAVWAGVAVRRLAVAVRYPADRISHFDKMWDNLRTAWAFTRLVTRRCLPWPHKQHGARAGFAELFRSGLTPRRLAAGVALGAAIGVAPIPGLQLIAAAWLALIFQLNPGVVLLASNISFGPLLPLWFAAEIALGRGLLEGSRALADLPAQAATLSQRMQEIGTWPALRPWLSAWLLGAPVVMVLVAVVAGGFTWLVATWRQRISPHAV